MSACPSRLELSRWEAQLEPARSAELAAHVEVCERCASIVADISEARGLLLGADPAAASARAARAILETVRQRRAPRRWLRFLVPALLVPAAALMLLVARPSVPLSGLGNLKGHLVVETYCKRGGTVSLATDGADYLQGDRLRFAYTQDRPGFLLVFGVDDDGKVFPYYQDDNLVGTRVEAGARVLLPGAVELDGHQGWERIFMVWTESPLSDSTVRSAVISALAAANGDLRRTSVLDLPGEQVSLLLRRP
jgi:hypothetical protein